MTSGAKTVVFVTAFELLYGKAVFAVFQVESCPFQ